MSEHDGDVPAGVFHLISGHEVVPNHCLFRTYVAVCGALVETSHLEGTGCPNECGCEFSPSMAYCSACLQEAMKRNGEAGVDVDCPPGRVGVDVVRAGGVCGPLKGGGSSAAFPPLP